MNYFFYRATILQNKYMEDSNTISTETKKRLNPVFVIGGFIVLGITVLLIVLNNRKTSQPEAEAVNNADTSGAQTSVPAGPVKEFTVNGSSFAFDPAIITVDKGDTVKITLIDDDGRHDLVVDGYNVSTNTLSEGGSDTIQFVADKTGSFEYYCSVANHRDLGMKGTLVVQ